MMGEIRENRDFVRVDELEEVRSGKVSRSSVYRAAKAGTIPSARLGRHLFVVRDFLAQLAMQNQRTLPRDAGK